MTKSIFAASALTFGLIASVASMPARADSGDVTLNNIFAKNDQAVKAIQAGQEAATTKAGSHGSVSQALDGLLAKLRKSTDDGKIVRGDTVTQSNLFDPFIDLSRN